MTQRHCQSNQFSTNSPYISHYIQIALKIYFWRAFTISAMCRGFRSSTVRLADSSSQAISRSKETLDFSFLVSISSSATDKIWVQYVCKFFSRERGIEGLFKYEEAKKKQAGQCRKGRSPCLDRPYVGVNPGLMMWVPRPATLQRVFSGHRPRQKKPLMHLRFAAR